jgi:hypothetical protein
MPMNPSWSGKRCGGGGCEQLEAIPTTGSDFQSVWAARFCKSGVRVTSETGRQSASSPKVESSVRSTKMREPSSEPCRPRAEQSFWPVAHYCGESVYQFHRTRASSSSFIAKLSTVVDCVHSRTHSVGFLASERHFGRAKLRAPRGTHRSSTARSL